MSSSYPPFPSRNRSKSKDGTGTSLVRQLSDRVQSASRRRLEHYSNQRAQDARDALPLIEKNKRLSSRPGSYYPTNSTYFPSSPPPSYQPHQLIAVCFNHMAGRECEHCRNLDRSSTGHHLDTSPDSHHNLNLGYQRQSQPPQRYSNASLHDERESDEGEKGGDQGSPPVVGFWHSKLAKLRLQLLGLWLKTSKRVTVTHRGKHLR